MRTVFWNNKKKKKTQSVQPADNRLMDDEQTSLVSYSLDP